MRRAYSYIRFSDRRQMAGDSLRRQLKLTNDYCERNGLLLDESLNLRDLGVSGFRGKNADTGTLALFLEAIKMKRVPAGSVLIVENLDRLSRDDIDEALPLFMGILKAGVKVVTVAPEREYTSATVRGNIGAILEIVLAFVLANDESRKKSDRVQAEWRERFTRLEKEKVTARVPAWLRLRADRKEFEFIPAAAATVRRIFRMAEEGHGIHSIARVFNAKGVPAIGRGDSWHMSYIRRILTSRAAIGEYQSYTGRGESLRPFGPPIPNYFPAVVSEAQFHRVQKAIKLRRNKSGPRGECMTNLFGGLLRYARDHGSIHIATKMRGVRALVASKATRGVRGSKYISFPYRAFEEAVLDRLAEVRAEDLLPESRASDAQERVALWSGRVSELDHKIAKTRERIDREPDIDIYLDLLADLEKQRREALAELDRAKQESTGGTSEAVGEVKSLVKLLQSVEGEELAELRSRLRGTIAEVVEEGWCLFTKIKMPGSRGRPYNARVACVQLHFRGNADRCRHYLIATNLKTKKWWVRSFADVGLSGKLDIREPKHTAQLEKLLTELPTQDE